MSLQQRRVVVTRPAQQALALLAALRAAGAEGVFFPVLEIAPVADPSPLLTLDLQEFDLTFFVSRNAVAQMLALRPQAEWPKSMQIATVGPASAVALREAGFAQVLVPQHSFDTEGVLALPAFCAVEGKRVLVLRGPGGRELLADTLRQRGAAVSVLTCYARRPANADASVLQAALAARRIDAVSFTSSEGAQYFAQRVPTGWQSLPCFVPHPRIAASVQALGAREVILTAVGDAGLLQSLRTYFG